MAYAHAASASIPEGQCLHCGTRASLCDCKGLKCVNPSSSVEHALGEFIKQVGSGNSRHLQLFLAGFEALDLIDLGLVVVDAAGRILLANRTADQMIRSRDGLEVTTQGELRARKGCGSSLLELAKAVRARPDGKPEKNGAVVAIRRPSGGRPLTLLLRSLESQATTNDTAEPATLIFMWAPAPSAPAAQEALRQLYGLTLAEIRLANFLMDGKTLEECGKYLGVRRSTLCTHLQSLFQKTKTQRQGQLVALLLQDVGLLRSPRPNLPDSDAQRSPGSPHKLSVVRRANKTASIA
jgi:DNA-binding CsgD family transcriptional regulator